MICGAADGELAALLVMGADLTSGPAAPAAHPGALASAESESCARGRRWVGDDGRPSGPGVKRL